MSASIEYDLQTGFIYACLSPALPDDVQMPEGRGKLVFPDHDGLIHIEGKMIDLKTLQIIDAPKPPATPPDVAMWAVIAALKNGTIPIKAMPDEQLTTINASLATVGEPPLVKE